MEKNTITTLLSQVNIISKKYDDIAKITGENFNVFQILRIESDEVRLHSRFIGELINPEGKHGQGPLFLKLFIQALNLNEYTEEALIKARIIIEENIGNISEDYSKGGRIDLVIKPNKGRNIVIENKIYAGDQHMQLWRYKQQYPDAHLFYLTLTEKKPDEKSTNGLVLDKDFKCITYENVILKWLEDCHKSSYNLPLIRETIAQYIYIIKHLTNQTINNKMESEIIKSIINNKDFIRAFLEIKKVSIEIEILKELIDRLKTDGFKFSYDSNCIGQNEFEIKFENQNLNYSVLIYFHNINNAIIGIYSNEIAKISKTNKHLEEDIELIEEQALKLNSITIGNKLRVNGKYGNWLWVCNFDFYNNTEWEDKISDEFYKEFKNIIRTIDENIIVKN